MSTSLVHAVSTHCFNKDGSLVALSPNTSEIFIYKTHGSEDSSKWTEAYTLHEHSGPVSALDWCHSSNMIVSCSHDRNAYVWSHVLPEDAWKPTLVVLRINRAAMDVKWSPQGNKFAVASGMKCVQVCSFEKAQDWWVSKTIRGHRSTVLSVAWSPNNNFIITGGCDFRARLISAYMKQAGDKEASDEVAALFPNANTFGELLATFDNAKAWIHSVDWSPNGKRVAFAGHGSSIHFAQLDSAQPVAQNIRYNGLPFLSIKFLSDRALVASGWDNNVSLFVDAGSHWEFKQLLDKADAVASVAKTDSNFGAAKAMWAAQTSKGLKADDSKSPETVLKTRHQNTITSIWKHSPGVITTAGIDGRVLFWDLARLGVDVAGLGIK